MTLRMRWYKRDHQTEEQESIALSMELRGAYLSLLNLIYRLADNVPDNDAVVSGALNCDVRAWKRLKSGLISAGKVEIIDGRLRIHHASILVEKTLKSYTDRAEISRRSNQISGGNPNGNNELQDPSINKKRRDPDQNRTQKTTTYLEQDQKEIPTSIEESLNPRVARSLPEGLPSECPPYLKPGELASFKGRIVSWDGSKWKDHGSAPCRKATDRDDRQVFN